MTPAQWQAAGGYFNWNGHRIFYRDDGGGHSALLLIHGFPTASWDYARVWPALCRRFTRVIAPDMLGFGFSDKPAAHPYSLVEQTDLHLALLAQLGVQRIHVLAHDYGVSVAQELLARQLERGDGDLQIASVALLNGGLFPETHRMTLTQRLLRSALGPWLARQMNQQRFGKSFSVVFGKRGKPTLEELQDFWSLIAYNQGARVMPRLIGYIDERRRRRARWVGALQNTKVPIRLINGPDDPVSGAHMVARYRELIAHPDTVSLPGVGHYPQTEAPDEVLSAYFEFLDRLKAAA